MSYLSPSALVASIVVTVLNSTCLAEGAAKLVGNWVVTSVESEGKLRDPMNFKGMHWLIGDGTLQVTPGRKTPAGLANKPNLKCTFRVDDKQSPAHFDWTLGEGKLTIPAIYELKGDTLRVCFAQRRQPRPTGFETQGQNWSVYEFKREKGDQSKE